MNGGLRRSLLSGRALRGPVGLNPPYELRALRQYARSVPQWLISGMAVKPVVRTIGFSAAARGEIIRIVPIRRDLHALTKCKANKSHKDDQCEKRPYPIWHSGSI